MHSDRQAIPCRPRLASTLVVLLGWVVAIAACGGDGVERVALTFRASSGQTATLWAEIADTATERQTGLSNRDSLGRDEGMLFVLEERLGFWMKDTRIPLSVAFIGACGEVLQLADMEPLSLEIHNSSADYRFGVETNVGWFDAHGIKAGDRLQIPERLKQPGCG